MPKIKKLLVTSDWHSPFVDDRALTLLYKFLKDWQPDMIVLNGDIIDCYEISRFRKVPLDEASMEHEIEIARKLFKKLRDVCPKAEITYIEGNHEMRWKKMLIEDNPRFYKLYRKYVGGYDIHLEYFLNCHKYNIEYKPVREELDKFSHNYIELNGVYIGHFDKINKNAGYTARVLRDELGANIIQAHTHRIGYSVKRYIDDIKYGMEIGCLCSNPTFLNNPDWAMGWLTAYMDEDKFYPYQITLKDYEFVFEGKKYNV